MAYFFIGLLMFLFTSLEQLKYNKVFSRIFLGIFTFILILFAGLRDGSSVGTDSPAYFFNYKFPYDYNVEFGYKYLSILFSKVFEANYNVFLIFLNALSIYLISNSLKRNSYFLVFPLLIYFSDFYLYYNFSGIRQAMALSFSCCAIYYAYNRNYKYFFLLILCASLFHISALVFSLAIIIPNAKMTIKNYVYLIFITVIGFFLVSYIIENNEYLSVKFKYYSEIQENSDNIVTQYIIGLLKRAIVLSLALIYRKQLFLNNRFIYLFNLYLLGVVIYASTYLISPDFGVRFSTYYTVVDMLLVGNMLYLCKNTSSKVIIFAIISLMVLYKINSYAILDTYIYKLAF